MLLSEDLKIQKEKMIKCIKYRDFETAAYISMYLSQSNPEFEMLSAILLYENKEYSRSLQFLEGFDDVTRIYYKALNYKARKEFSEAIAQLSIIIEGKAKNQCFNDSFIQTYTLSTEDSEFFESLMGQLMIIKGKCYPGIDRFRKSFFKNPLLGPCYSLFDENVWIAPINDFKNDIIMNFYQNLFSMNIQTQTVDEIPRNISEMIEQYPMFNEYFINTPGFGSYFLSKIAACFTRFTMSNVGNEIFEYLRKKDSHFIKELDVYSTALWVAKNYNHLGLLAKELIYSNPKHYITWVVLGNYYSIAGMPKESYTCFMKSLSIEETHNAYTLLGFECNSKNQYLEAQNFFRSSLCMLENNDRAYFGMGISLSEMSKKNSAETYFNKALLLNPRNINMRALVVRFYVKNKNDDISLQKIQEFLGIRYKSYHEIAEYILKRMGEFKEMEELIILEFCELLVRFGRRDLAKDILACVNCRTKTYFSKRSIVEGGNQP